MTLEQLRIFVAVAEREHVTEAARKLNLTQSAVSAALAALEARHDTKLFDRIGRRIELNRTGRLFLAEARAVLARAEDAERLFDELAGLSRGVVAIAASQTAGNYWLPARMHAFRQRHPGVHMVLEIGNTLQVAASVASGKADLGIAEDFVEHPDLQVRPVADDRLVLVAPPDHPLGRKLHIEPVDLVGCDWIMRERGSGTRAHFETAMREISVDPAALSVSMELPSNEAVRVAIEAGAGLSALSHLVVSASLHARRLVAIAVDLPERRFYSLTHESRHVGRAARTFLGELCPEASAP